MRVGIIGAGPTGILAANLLTKQGVEVALVEAGDFDVECLLTLQDYDFQSPSKMIHGVHKVAGGTNGWKGRVSRFPQSAIESKNVLGSRIWPINWNEIKSAYEILAEILHIAPIEDTPLRTELHSCPDCENLFTLSPFQFIDPFTFRKMFRSIESSNLFNPHLRTYCKTIRRTGEALTLECIKEIAGYPIPQKLEVDFVFIAAGCLQSTALVKRSFPLDSQEMPVGKFLQEHFDGYIGRLHIRKKDKACLRNFTLDYNRKLKDVEFGVGLSAENHLKLHWHLEISPLARVYTFDPTANRFNLSPKLLKVFFNLERLVSAPLFRVFNFMNTLIGRETFSLWLKGEEFPYAHSQLDIESEDSKKVIYKHLVSRETSKQIWIELNSFKRVIREQKLGKIVFSPYIYLLRKITTGANWHPLGSLRMHASESAVLNHDLSLKIESRVFCIDSSSFPTGAHHNPTAMALTLTIIAVKNLLQSRL